MLCRSLHKNASSIQHKVGADGRRVTIDAVNMQVHKNIQCDH